MGECVLVAGTGLIGGSIGMALREAGGVRVIGFDSSAESAARAVELGAADESTTSVRDAAHEADVVFVATPVGQVLPMIEVLAGALRPGAVVTDVGSTKAPIVPGAERLIGASFVGGHPMAGSEREGVEAARPDLFREALWILTPTKTTDPDAFRRVHALVARVGARVLALEPAEHDRLVALVSHLPYAIATSLMALAGAESDERVFQAAAGSFRDVTRTAGSSPHVWRDILSTNREAVLKEIDAFAGALGEFRAAVHDGDWDAIDAVIERARNARMRLPLKGTRGPTSPLVLEIPIPDRSGMLAAITTAVGSLGINIEDLRVEHEGAGGVVHLVVDGRNAADRAAAMLRERGLRVDVLDILDE